MKEAGVAKDPVQNPDAEKIITVFLKWLNHQSLGGARGLLNTFVVGDLPSDNRSGEKSSIKGSFARWLED